MSSPRTREIRSNVKQVDAVPSFGTGGLLMSVVALRGWLTPASHTRRVESPDGPRGLHAQNGRRGNGEPVARYVARAIGFDDNRQLGSVDGNRPRHRMIPVDGTCGCARLFMVRPHIIRYRDAPKIGFEPLHAGGGMRYGGSIVK